MRLLVLAALLAGTPATAAPPFVVPADCTLGESCWVVRYVDRDPGPGLLDVGCGTLTGDGHRGTDFAVPDMGALARGVAVLSPAAGTIIGVRDGMPDISADAPNAPPFDDRNCGNGVRVEHGDGWVSQLCHLRRGSLLVANGDQVAAGQAVGRIGLSGETSFPHVHWTLWQNDVLVDPYDGSPVADGAACETSGTSLIEGAPTYDPLPLVDAGFAPAPPEDADVLRGWHAETVLPSTTPALVLWLHAYGTQAGDQVSFEIEGPIASEGPGERVLMHETTLERGHARGSYFAGTRRPAAGWPAGRYVGEVTWRRGEAIARRRVELEVTAQP